MTDRPPLVKNMMLIAGYREIDHLKDSTRSSRKTHLTDHLSFSSKAYFSLLLDLIHTTDSLHTHITAIVKDDTNAWMAGLMAGFVSSADTGNEDLIIDSRAALTDHCEQSPRKLRLVCSALLHNLKTCQGEDRIIVPTLEMIAFLFHVGLFQRCERIDYKSLCLQTQKAGYKTGNVRKVAACIKVYGGIAAAGVGSAGDNVEAGAKDARKRLGALMAHPWPRIRSAVVDEIWGLVDSGELAEEDDGHGLTGVDWTSADRSRVKALVTELKLE